MSDRLRYAPGEPVKLRARLLDDKGVPIEKARPYVEIRNERNEVVKRNALQAEAGGGGEYTMEVTGLPRGRFTVIPQVFELRDKELKAEVSFTVGDVAAGEYVHLAAQEALLEKWADLYRRFHDPQALLDTIEPIELRDEKRGDYEIWDTFWVLLLVAALLGLEWHFRKTCRLV